jgi:hypothetical protein
MWYSRTRYISSWEGGTINDMRGRKPHLISLSEAERIELQRLIGSGKTEQRIARRSRILLAMENPHTRVEELARHLEITRVAIWKLCRRYEEGGIKAIYDTLRSGRPRVFSPLGQSADRAACLLRTSGYRIRNDSLVNKEFGQGSSREGDSPKDSAFHSFPGLEDSGSATSSQSVLENANLE